MLVSCSEVIHCKTVVSMITIIRKRHLALESTTQTELLKRVWDFHNLRFRIWLLHLFHLSLWHSYSSYLYVHFVNDVTWVSFGWKRIFVHWLSFRPSVTMLGRSHSVSMTGIVNEIFSENEWKLPLKNYAFSEAISIAVCTS